MKTQYRVTSMAVGRKQSSTVERFRGTTLPELLEARTMLSAYTVNSAADDGSVGTLRDAIKQVNLGNFDEIDFNFSSPTIIALGSALDHVAMPVLINGTKDASGNAIVTLDGRGVVANALVIDAANVTVKNLALGNFSSAAVLLETGGNDTLDGNYIGLDYTGTLARPNATGVSILSGGNTLIGNVISANTQDAVDLTGDGNKLVGNLIGTDAHGNVNFDTVAVQNTIGNGGVGIFATGATHTTIGGPGTSDRNLISGNLGTAVLLDGGSSNTVEGNWIGTDSTGHAGPYDSDPWADVFVFGNMGDGVRFQNATTGNLVTANILSGNAGSGLAGNAAGTLSAVTNNLIGVDVAHLPDGNSGNGILIRNGAISATGNTISANFGNGVLLDIGAQPSTFYGNFVGTDASLATGLGNQGAGFVVHGTGTVNNAVIGGTAAGQGNVIAFNAEAGVWVQSSNGNSIRGNSIFSNGLLGIALGGVETDVNTPTGTPTSNNNQAYPTLSTVIGATATGTMNGLPSTTYLLDFYSNASPDPSGYGEGQTYLGSVTVTTDSTGAGTFTTTFANVPAGQSYWGATATDLAGNTSQFSADVLAQPKASPTMASTPVPASVTLSTGLVTLNDTATLTGGNNEAGSITFTLYYNSNLVYSNTVPVSGDGTYTTPGYILPTSGGVTGTYQWNASYSGDTRNNGVDDFNDPKEQVMVSPASPSLITTPGAPVVVGAANLTASATLSGGYFPTGQITFSLYDPNNLLVDTEQVTASGNGTYTTPTGYLPVTAGSYHWAVSYGADANNTAASADGYSDVAKASPTMTTAPGGTVVIGSSANLIGSLTDSAIISGGFTPGGTIVFTLYAPSDTTQSNPLDTETVAVNGNGTYSTPNGFVPSTPGVYQWVATYSGDTNNNGASDTAGETANPAPPPPSGSVTGTVYCDDNLNGVFDTGDQPLQGAVVTLMDSTGQTVGTSTTDANGVYTFGNLAAGTYQISVTNPAAGHSAELSHGTVTIPATPVSLSVAAGQSLAGPNFPEISPGGLSGFVWDDANNDGKIDWNEVGVPNVVVTLTGADIYGRTISVSMTTDDTGEYVFDDLTPGTYSIGETLPTGLTQGTLSLGSTGGTIATPGQVYGGSTTGNCSRGYLNCAGWYSSYSASNQCGSVSTQCGSSQQVFSSIPISGCDDYGVDYNFGTKGGSLSCSSTASTGFWHSCYGQSLLKGLNGSSSSKALGQWLAGNFPNLYGVGAKVNLANMTNAQIASYYNLNDFAVAGQKLNAQVLATAFACYVTSSKLAGGNYAANFGFKVTTDGCGYQTINVGSNGAAFNVANNTTISIMQALDATNDDVVNMVLYGGSTTLDNMALAVYSAINQSGGNL